MNITDDIYGTYKVEAVITELINTPIFQRMKGIYTGGGASLVEEKWRVNRYDHSIGTLILAKKLGGTIEEQIRALLHDVSHTAFSHVIDYIMDNENENYHDTIQQEIIDRTEIPQILNKHNLDVKKIFHTEYLVLDAELPDLSIDRIDYTIRDLIMQETVSRAEVQTFIEDLHVYDNIVSVTNEQMASWFIEQYHKEVELYFKHPLNIYANTALTDILRIALIQKAITLADFSLFTDAELLEKIEHSGSKELIDRLEKLKNTNMSNFNQTPNRSTIKLKDRVIQPKIMKKESII